MNRWLPVASLLLCACPEEVMLVADSGHPDAGVDAGVDGGTDAGHPMRDAGVADAGYQDVAIADWCTDFVRVQCQRDERCTRFDDSLMATCLYRKGLTCDSYAYSRSAAEGRLAYDARAAARCLNAYVFDSCTVPPADCASVFSGRTAPLGACFVDEDCDPDAGFCDPYDGQCPHRCSPWAQLGQPCSTSFSPLCGPGLGCETADGGLEICIKAHGTNEACSLYTSCGTDSYCISGACVKQTAALGEPCDSQTYPLCDIDSFCHQDPPATAGGTSPPGVCVHRQGLGGVCFGAGTCLLSLRCSSAIGAGTCVPYSKLGDACSNDDYYGNGDCQDGLYCPVSTSHCAPLLTDGGDCSDTGSNFKCAAGYACAFDNTLICEALHADGTACDSAQQCLSNDCEFGVTPDGGFGGVCYRCSHVADAGS